MTRSVRPMMGIGKERFECAECGLTYKEQDHAIACEQHHLAVAAKAAQSTTLYSTICSGCSTIFPLGRTHICSRVAARPTECPSPPKADVVNNPSHYTAGGIETIDFIKAKLTPEEYRGYLRGNAMKYQSRTGLKGEALEDAQKCSWYQDRLVALLAK